MKQSLLQAIIAFLLGQKYYVNIVNTRGTNRADISSFIFSTKAEAMKHRVEIEEGTLSYRFVETVSFRSRNIYRIGMCNNIVSTIIVG